MGLVSLPLAQAMIRPLGKSLTFHGKGTTIVLSMQEGNEIEKFAVLEDRLNEILKGYTALKEEKESIFSQMREQKEEVEKLRGEISTLKNERLEIRTRIDRLIERLEGIPLDLDR